MSVRSSILRSSDDNKRFSSKSYANLELGFEILEASKFIAEQNNEMRKRLFSREFSVDKVVHIIKLFNKGDELITVNQIRDIFDDVGFNTDVSFSEYHNGDIIIVYNVGGYLIPGWEKLAKLLYGRKENLKHLFLTKLSPGRKRFHCRIYHNDDGCWYVTSHIDEANWMNIINPIQAIKSHFMKGTGDYILGTRIMIRVMDEVIEKFKNRSRLYVNVDEIYQEESSK